ncbi:MAG: transglutaminaseTgpA domain-containing protein [Acidimicrobiia bacterium]|nr:transglutaminaseTgpA domain-containing protein [Acidimicrobiia bacterium]MDH5504545.1 transglutaminaseTgpA domain-containing protein [Acidimicrobiia bacterium]
MKLAATIREANLATDPEPFICVRVAVGSTVMISVIALIAQGFVRTAPALVAIVGIPVGFAISYRMRHSDALTLKAILAIALVVSVIAFFGELVSSFQEGLVDIQVPLAELFLWVQVIHSLHVPARRDLMFSLASSAAMMAITAALSISSTLGAFILLWAAGLVVSLRFAYRSSITDLPALGKPGSSITAGATRAGATSVGFLAVMAVAVFLALPSARASRALTFPANLPSSNALGSPGSLSNPSLGRGNQNQQVSSGGGASSGYFGFAEQLDTSARGRPDGTLVMRVRASAPAFWRGQTFDVWDGVTWKTSDDTSATIGGPAPIQIPLTVGDAPVPADDFIQTFYIEQPGPNLVFGAYRISEVYFDSRFLFQQPDGALRAGSDLGRGAVYTVISARPHVTEALLRVSDPLRNDLPVSLDPFLQLPDDVPQRVLDLAQEVTADSPTTYDKIRALEAWMADNTTYSLDIPPLPEGADSVDEYLFETRQGFCEQIGTSLVVMLRSLGVPSRLAVGFIPGERNPLTGLYEVRASDAHSWAEVYFPGIGWQGFDPTTQVPLAGEFDPPATAGAVVAAWARENAGLVGRGLGVTLAIVLVGGFGGMLVSVTSRLLSERRRKANRTWVERATEELENAGARHDRPRQPYETIREYVGALVDGPIPDPRLLALGEIITEEAFAPSNGGMRPPDGDKLIAAISDRPVA